MSMKEEAINNYDFNLRENTGLADKGTLAKTRRDDYGGDTATAPGNVTGIRPPTTTKASSRHDSQPLPRRLSESIRTNEWSNVDAWKPQYTSTKHCLSSHNVAGSYRDGSQTPSLHSSEPASMILPGLGQRLVIRSSLPPSSPPDDLDLDSSPLPIRIRAQEVDPAITPYPISEDDNSARAHRLDDGRHGSDVFAYRAAERRTKPRRILSRVSSTQSRPPSRASSRQQSSRPLHRSLLSISSIAAHSLGNDNNERNRSGTRNPTLTKTNSRRSRTTANKHLKLTIYDDLLPVGLDSVLSIPDLSSSPWVFKEPKPGDTDAGNRIMRKNSGNKVVKSRTGTGLSRKMKRMKGSRKKPDAQKDLEREVIELGDGDDDDEEIREARKKRIEYFEALEGYQLKVENVYVV